MASTSQIRNWWRGYLRTPSKYVKVAFPTGPNTSIKLSVAGPTKPIWEAVAQILAEEGYYFLESAGGTYNPRFGQVPPSVHANGVALDINPSKNPYQNPLKTNIPARVITRIEGIRANGKQAVMWGGRWPPSNPPDAMHFQINVPPVDCKNITWGGGSQPAPSPAPTPAPVPVPPSPSMKDENDMWPYLNIDESLVRHVFARGWVQGDINHWLNNLAELQKGDQAAVAAVFRQDWLDFRRAVTNGLVRQ